LPRDDFSSEITAWRKGFCGWWRRVRSSDLREWLFHSHMGSGSGVTNSSGVGSGVGTNYLSGVTLGGDILFGSDFGSGLFAFGLSAKMMPKALELLFAPHFLTTFWFFFTQCDTLTHSWHHKSSNSLDPQMTAEGTVGAPTCYCLYIVSIAKNSVFVLFCGQLCGSSYWKKKKSHWVHLWSLTLPLIKRHNHT
jgi:hypothetical protein